MHYAIPVYHACQLLCEMYAKNARETWYFVCSQKTVLLTTVQFDEEVWNNLFSIIEKCNDVISPARPQRINNECQKLKSVLQKYVEEKSEFICEVPKVEASPIKSMKRCSRLNPFRSVYTCRNRQVDFSKYVDDVSYSLTTAEKLIHNVFNIQQNPAGHY